MRFQLFMRNYLNKLTKILQFQETDNANRFYGKNTGKFFFRFDSDTIVSLVLSNVDSAWGRTGYSISPRDVIVYNDNTLTK